MKEVAVIMVTWGRRELLKTTLTSYFATTDPTQASITVVDNGSKQDTLDVLMEHRPDIDSLILLNENRGKPYALNSGAVVAMQDAIRVGRKPPDYFLFCDSDLFFHKGWLSVMVSSYDDNRTVAGGKPLGGLSGYVHAPHQLKLHTGKKGVTVNQLGYCAGCCMMMSRKVFMDNGPWDTRRLIRTVDTRYMRNLLRRGYMNAAVYPDTVIMHTGKKERTWHIANGTPKYRS